MNTIERKVAQTLLQIKAIKLSPANYFTWASGWHSPIYCDNRKILSFPEARKLVYESFAEVIAEKYPDVEVVAGVATGAIAHGVLAAEKMGKPFIYVRSAPKSHGLENQVEGEVIKAQKLLFFIIVWSFSVIEFFLGDKIKQLVRHFNKTFFYRLIEIYYHKCTILHESLHFWSLVSIVLCHIVESDCSMSVCTSPKHLLLLL